MSEDGATAIEYSFIIALIGVATVGAFSNFSEAVTNLWEHVESGFTESVDG